MSKKPRRYWDKDESLGCVTVILSVVGLIALFDVCPAAAVILLILWIFGL